MTPLMNMARWNMAILMSVEWWTLTSESRSSETLVFCFSPRDFPLKIPGHEESDTMQLSLQITWHRQQKPVETCFKLTMQKKNMSCFPMETPISNQGETCGCLPLSKPKPSLIKIGTTANMQPPLVPETPGLGAPKSTAPRCKAMFLSHKIHTWHFARRRRRPEAFQKKQPRLLRSHWKEARAQVRCNLSLWNFKGLHGSDLVFGITSFSQKIPAWFGKHLSCTWKRPWHEPWNTSWWIVNRSLWLAS